VLCGLNTPEPCVVPSSRKGLETGVFNFSPLETQRSEINIYFLYWCYFGQARFEMPLQKQWFGVHLPVISQSRCQHPPAPEFPSFWQFSTGWFGHRFLWVVVTLWLSFLAFGSAEECVPVMQMLYRHNPVADSLLVLLLFGAFILMMLLLYPPITSWNLH
jgi:hypothetical protein